MVLAAAVPPWLLLLLLLVVVLVVVLLPLLFAMSSLFKPRCNNGISQADRFGCSVDLGG